MTHREAYGVDVLECAFPFHFLLDGTLRILRAGRRLQEVASGLQSGEALGETLCIKRPEPNPTFDKLKSRTDDVFIIDVTTVVGLHLRGQFFPIEDQGAEALIFLGHPWITDLAQLEEFGLKLHDFPTHAGIADMLVLLQTTKRGLIESRSLTELLKQATNELELRNEQLEEELEHRKKLEETVLHAQKMEAIGQLAGGVAHDFNNILLAISGHAALAARKLGEDHLIIGDLHRILDATKRASELTSRLLAFGRRQVMIPIDVDIASALDEVGQILNPLLGESIYLSIKHPPDVGAVKIDPSAMQQILLNLAINSRDSFEGEGSIVIRAETLEQTEPRQLATGILDPGSWISIEVVDDGSGMEQETIDRIFEPFFTTKKLGDGTGLGLSTVWWILERCGGKIDVVSRPDKGTTFTVFLPRSSKGAQGESSNQADSPSVPVSGRILLVEDEEMVRIPVAEMLRQDGWRVTEAANADEAIEKAKNAAVPFDMVLTDMVMPGMDGRELAGQLRKRWPDLPIVLMTGYDAGVAGSALGDQDYILTKPFSTNDLASMLQRARSNSTD